MTPDAAIIVAVTAAAMRVECTRDASSYEYAMREVGDLHVHLSRCGQDWRLELNAGAPLSPDDAAAWLRACGAPDDTPLYGSAGGRVYCAQWEDAAFDATPGARATMVFGGGA